MLKNLFHLNEQGKRNNLEDSLYPMPGNAKPTDYVFLVCDGVGGENKGEVASKIICDTIGKDLSNLKPSNIHKISILNAIQKAINSLHEYIETNPDALNMSTTLTLACINKNTAWVAWCGDSRIYHIRNGKIIWRSKDHSLVQQLVDTGEISEEEALNHPRKNIILRSINASTNVSKIDINHLTNLKEGDYLLLFTDGILEQINDFVLTSILSNDNKSNNTINKFIDYCDGKTNDNYSMYLLEVGKTSIRNRKLIFIGILILFFTSIFSYIYLSEALFHNKAQNEIPSIKIDSSNQNIKNHKNHIMLPVLKKKNLR